jgi:hypothetical protein
MKREEPRKQIYRSAIQAIDVSFTEAIPVAMLATIKHLFDF